MKSIPFASKITSEAPQGDRAVSDDDLRKIIRSIWSNGVTAVNPDGSDLQVQAAYGMTVKVMPGGCIIGGAIGREDNIRPITIDDAHPTLKRIDRIVARFDLSESQRNIEIYKKVGTPSTTPVAQELVRQPNFYEIALADVYVDAGVSGITNNAVLDQRGNNELCGYVMPAFPMSFDLSEISTRWQELLQSAVEGTAAGNLQNAINKLRRDIQTADMNVIDVHINSPSLESELVDYFGSSISV